ncbi:uncharacterized protein [Haliaeetus albicilla]|uniref:uncharacterized protein isoform X2 n=1 Tax=Haliaeetus albicilla TaxID=8969 RepID=UPI0037E91314
MTTRLEQYQTRAAQPARRSAAVRTATVHVRCQSTHAQRGLPHSAALTRACRMRSTERPALLRSVRYRGVPLRCFGSGPVQLLTPSVLAGVSGQTEQLGRVHRCGYGCAPDGLRCAVRRVTSAWERSVAACSAGLCSPGVPQCLPQHGPVCTLSSSDPLELWGKQMGPGAEFSHSIHGRRSAGCSKHAQERCKAVSTADTKY